MKEPNLEKWNTLTESVSLVMDDNGQMLEDQMLNIDGIFDKAEMLDIMVALGWVELHPATVKTH